MNNETIIRVENLYKIYGKEINKAIKMKEEGIDKNEINKKTGTTIASGRCLVSTGSLNGRTVIVVVLKSNSANIWKDSSKLLRWALESPASVG